MLCWCPLVDFYRFLQMLRWRWKGALNTVIMNDEKLPLLMFTVMLTVKSREYGWSCEKKKQPCTCLCWRKKLLATKNSSANGSKIFDEKLPLLYKLMKSSIYKLLIFAERKKYLHNLNDEKLPLLYKLLIYIKSYQLCVYTITFA